MTSSATRGLLAGVGKGLAMAGEMGLKDHYEALRQKKAQEYKLEGMSVQNEYATESQNRNFAHDETMTATAQENAEGLLNKRHENDLDLADKKNTANSQEASINREFTAEENEKNRKSKVQASGGKEPLSVDYYKSIIKAKNDELKSILNADAMMGNEESSTEVLRLRQEISQLQNEYARLAGASAPQAPSGQHKSSSGITFTVE